MSGLRKRVVDVRPDGEGYTTFRCVAALWLAWALVAALAAVAPAAANAALVSATDGHLWSFSAGTTQSNGTLRAVSRGYGADTQAFAASVLGSSPGLAQGALRVSWQSGAAVSYGAVFFLPTRFHAATAGQQTLLQWQGAPEPGGNLERGGVVVDYRDNSAYVVGATLSGSGITQRVLAGPFTLPVGRWFTLRVRQRLARAGWAYTKVSVNGALVASSTAPTFAGAQVTRVAYGIVALSSPAQQGPVSVVFDQAFAGAYNGYVNPLRGDRYFSGRTDMGVDFCLTPGEPVRALGDGLVTGISPNWFRHQPYIWYQLLDGPYAGHYVYAAEQIRGLARVGTLLSAGRPLAYYRNSGSCIEMGWSAADGATRAQATTGYHEAQITRAGVSFAHLLITLGVWGRFELTPSG